MPSDARGDLFARLPVSDRAKADLARRMADPARHYHARAHLDLLWSRHCRFAEAEGLAAGALEDLVACAIAYHDAVYVGGSPDNERRSAALWLEVSAQACPLDADSRRWVAETILATADHLGAARDPDRSAPRDHARQWVLDLDLTPLGEAPAIFDRNMALLNAEVPHLSEERQRSDLIAALRHFASAPRLYRCEAIAAHFEAAAQSNFRRHLPA